MNILFVDDDYEAEIVTRILSAQYMNHKFELADSLIAARRKLWEKKYGLIFLDIMMPANDDAVPHSSDNSGLLSGLTLYEMMRASSDCPNRDSKVMFLTGLSLKETPRLLQFYEKNKEQFLIKPVHPKMFGEIFK